MNEPAAASIRPRANGLDTLRAAAIALVFMYHYQIFVSHEATFGWLSAIGWVGVDLFFVLSGYLIANQIFAGIARGERLSARAFYLRRALRTLPAFWLVLACYFLFPLAMGGKTPPSLWRFLTFTQNIGLQSGTAFSHAWSLCIEEQFYLLLPPVLFVALRYGRGRAQAWMLLSGLIAFGIVARCLLWQTYGREGGGQIGAYYPNVYYATLCRFDEFLPGVAVALLKNFHRPLWQHLMRRGQAVLLLGMLATAATLFGAYRYYYIDGYGYGFFMSGFGYSLIAMAFAVLVMAALSPASWLYRLRIPGAYSLAVASYSIYLSHKPLAHVVQQGLKPYDVSPAALLLAVVGACLLCGWLLYWLVESPFMRLRDRLAASSFVAPRRPSAVVSPPLSSMQSAGES